MALGEGVTVLAVEGGDVAGAAVAVVLAVVLVADLPEAEHNPRLIFFGITEGDQVPLAGRGGAAVGRVAAARRDPLVVGGPDLDLEELRGDGDAGDVGDVAVVEVGPAPRRILLGG